MEIYDIIMLAVLLAAMLFGAIKGFAWQLASIGSIGLSYIVAYKYREPFSQSIQADPPWNRFLAMAILYVGTSLVIWVIFRMIRGTIDRMKLREFDRQVGAMFGLAKGAIYCLLITLFAVTLMGDRVREKIVSSKSGRYIAQVLDRSQAVIPTEIHDVVAPYLAKFDRRFQDGVGGPLNRVPWPAEGLAEGQPNRLHRLPSGLTQSLSESVDQAVNRASPWNSNPGPGQPGSAHPPLPIDPRQWVPERQAQQPVWNGYQR
jgi:membrane protein required for colicin V production